MAKVKRLIVFTITLTLLLGLSAPTVSANESGSEGNQVTPFYLGEPDPGADPDELTGPKRTETVYISNAELLAAGGTALASERLLLKYLPYTNLIGVGGAAATLAGYLNQGSGYEVTLHLQYGTKEVFDGQWVEHTGWHLIGQSTSVY